MVDVRPLEAQIRERAGKGAARAVRRTGRVPAVIYGNHQAPVMISLDPITLNKELNRTTFFNHILEIDYGSNKERVLPRDVQLHPVTDVPLHLDFMRFSRNTRLTIEIAVEFINEEACTGLRRGGVLNVVRHTIEVHCSPDNIPDILTADLDGLNVGDGIHISNIMLPEGVTPTITDRDFTIATIAAPTVAVEEEEGETEEAVEETEENSE